MAIENGNYVKLSYTGSVNGAPFDTTDAEEAQKAGIFRENALYGPVVAKFGAGHVLPCADVARAGEGIGQA